jgi:hypothetical protein
VAVVEVCAYAMPVINAVLNNAIAIYFDFMVSSIVSCNNTGYPAWFHWLERACSMRLDDNFQDGSLPIRCRTISALGVRHIAHLIVEAGAQHFQSPAIAEDLLVMQPA